MSRQFPSYNVFRDRTGQYRWSYEASNGKTIAVSSESYVRYEDARHSVDLMKGSSKATVYVPQEKVRAY